MSQQEKAAFHRRTIEGLNAQYLKLQNRIDQIYLDKLDGEVEEAFYRRYVGPWREEQDRIRQRIQRHQKADENYIEQGIRLVEIAQDAHRLFQEKGQPERAALICFLLAGSELKDKTVVHAFRPPFDIIWRLAQEGRKHQEDIEKKAAEPSAACMILLRQRESNDRPGA